MGRPCSSMTAYLHNRNLSLIMLIENQRQACLLKLVFSSNVQLCVWPWSCDANNADSTQIIRTRPLAMPRPPQHVDEIRFWKIMLGRRLFRGSWSALVAWRRSFHLQRGFLTQGVGVQTDCRSTRAVEGMFSNWSAPYLGTAGTRGLHCYTLLSGLEEFFPKTENLIEEGEKTGIATAIFTTGWWWGAIHT